jgi:hypothetical protein
MAYSSADFAQRLLGEFPQLEGEVRQADGLLHLQMFAFANLTQLSKETADWSTYQRGVRLVSTLWSEPDDALENALNVSFFEALDFEGPNGPDAWAMLTPELQRGWENMRDYLKTLGASQLPQSWWRP